METIKKEFTYTIMWTKITEEIIYTIDEEELNIKKWCVEAILQATWWKLSSRYNEWGDREELITISWKTRYLFRMEEEYEDEQDEIYSR